MGTSALRRYILIWLAWTAAGLFYVTQDFALRVFRNESVPLGPMFVGWMAAMYVCAALTPFMLRLGSHWPVERENRWRRVALHFCFAAVFSVVETAIEAPILVELGVLPGVTRSTSFGAAFFTLLVYGFHGNVIRYWAVIGAQAVFRSHQVAQQREREALQLKVHSAELASQLSAAQLSALKMQLHPHFLFNTLGAIMVLARQQKGHEAELMLSRLSDLLRHALDHVETQEAPLWRELEFLRLYLSIEQVRFQDRLRVEIAADPEVSEASVPHMILQPIVENAVRHGLGQSEEAVLIEVTAFRSGSDLMLAVTDDGPGSPSNGFHGKGIGLANTRDRLDRLYGPKAMLQVENMSPRGVQVIVRLPFQVGSREDEECA